MATPPQVIVASDDNQPLITKSADKALIRIMIASIGSSFVLLALFSVTVQFANQPRSFLFPVHRFLDVITTLLALLPFFIGINRMNAVRLQYARRFAEEGNWRGVYSSVESFSQLGQRWMDPTGEAHYLLSVAYERQGERAKAAKERTFVMKHRPNSDWAKKLMAVEASRTPKRMSEIKAKREESGRKFVKSKRRF
jgi:hypothetical protein